MLLSVLLTAGVVGVAVAITLKNDDAQQWVYPHGLPEGHNGGFLERLVEPAGDKKPHILFILFDDYGWADASWHRNYTFGGIHVPATDSVQTPTLHALVDSGINMDRSCRCYLVANPTFQCSVRFDFHLCC